MKSWYISEQNTYLTSIIHYYYYLYIEYLHLNHVQFQFVSTWRKNIPEQNERCESVIHQVYNAAGGVLQFKQLYNNKTFYINELCILKLIEIGDPPFR